METVNIRRAAAGEVEQLQKISRQTFSETYSGGNTEENMKKYLEEEFSMEKLAAELNDPRSEFYFAVQGDMLAGYLKLNFGQAQTDLKDANAVEIERIYVLQAFQRMKIGQLLCEKAADIARQAKAGYIWLGVWEKIRKPWIFIRSMVS